VFCCCEICRMNSPPGTTQLQPSTAKLSSAPNENPPQ
jgi:hypothetical protein